MRSSFLTKLCLIALCLSRITLGARDNLKAARGSRNRAMILGRASAASDLREEMLQPFQQVGDWVAASMLSTKRFRIHRIDVQKGEDLKA